MKFNLFIISRNLFIGFEESLKLIIEMLNVGSKNLVELLLHNGADINAVNDRKNSALILSIDTGRGNH